MSGFWILRTPLSSRRRKKNEENKLKINEDSIASKSAKTQLLSLSLHFDDSNCQKNQLRPEFLDS
jgi:hypothetical protein